jgi:biopolymer transport protein ExbD
VELPTSYINDASISLTVMVNDDNEYTINGKMIGSDTLEVFILKYISDNTIDKFILQADKETNWESAVNAINIAKDNQLKIITKTR